MPTLSFSSDAALVATIHYAGPPMREVQALDVGGGLVEIELADVEVGARLIGQPETLANLLADAVDALARLRGQR